MQCTIKKANKQTVVLAYLMVSEPYYPNKGSNWGTNPKYKVVEVVVSRGKVRRVKEEPYTVNVVPWSSVDVPSYVLADPRFIKLMDAADKEYSRDQARRTADYIESVKDCYNEAKIAIEADVPAKYMLSERLDKWIVTEKLAQLWLEWASGKVFWDVYDHYAPEWAMKLRGIWDMQYRRCFE